MSLGSVEALANVDQDLLLMEVIRGTDGQPSLCYLSSLVKGFREGQVMLDLDSAEYLIEADKKSNSASTWGEFALNLAEVISEVRG